MVLKVEIRAHDGIGRINRVNSNEKDFTSPNIVEPYSIPIYHDLKGDSSVTETNNSSNQIRIGYLPALHHFSKFSSDEAVTSIILDEYIPKIDNNDFISFPLDKASVYRTKSLYPDFILKISNSIDRNFAWIYQENDVNTNWIDLKQLPMMIVGGLSSIFKNQRQTWNLMVNLENFFPLTLKYAPAMPPTMFPLFTYLGIDFFDSLYGQFMAQNNIFLDFDHTTEIKDFKSFESPCPCLACEQKSDFDLTKTWLNIHNKKFSETMISRVKIAIQNGTLRDLVKKIVLNDPTSTGLLRIADLDQENKLLEKYTPSIKKNTLYLTSNSDYIRPEIKMFHNRVKERFSIPEWTEMIILIPCSARKPYSESKSHKIFSSTIKSMLKAKRHSVLELIITSPLGVVPRFFEQVYPAGMYDIPVTGNWSDLEQNLVEEMLVSIFSQIPKELPIVSYLAEPEKSIVQNFAKKFPHYNIQILDLIDKEISPESLALLRNYLYHNKEKINSTASKNDYNLEFFRAMADYQFGKNAGCKIFPKETEIRFKNLQLTASLNNKQLATLHLGHLSLTASGASNLANSFDSYKVFFADSEINGSAVYTPGIVKADPQIKPEDDVLVFSQKTGDFLALGKSHLSGYELENSSFGLGVSIKKKLKKN
jgi:archaeosine synthase